MVEPEAEILVLCPICTHNMRFSSYVLSPEHSLTVTMEGNGRKPIYLFVLDYCCITRFFDAADTEV